MAIKKVEDVVDEFAGEYDQGVHTHRMVKGIMGIQYSLPKSWGHTRVNLMLKRTLKVIYGKWTEE